MTVEYDLQLRSRLTKLFVTHHREHGSPNDS